MASSEESQVVGDFNFEKFFDDIILGPLNEIQKKDDDKKKPMWNACILWDGHVYEEFNAHEASQCKLYTSLSLGRLMSLRLMASDELAQGAFSGIAAMDWKKQFIMVIEKEV